MKKYFSVSEDLKKKKILSLYFHLPNVTSCFSKKRKKRFTSVLSASVLSPEAIKESRTATQDRRMMRQLSGSVAI